MSQPFYYVYIITNRNHTTLYTGITNNLIRRITEHKQGIGSTFSWRYKLRKLVYYEIHPEKKSAIDREKQIKAGSRNKKLDLINSLNLDWDDLFDSLF
jgi:putative endonuclease